MPKIILMRHGEVDIAWKGKVTSKDFPEWIKTYNSASVLRNASPGSGVLEIIYSADAIVCSQLRRSVDSVGLAGQKPLESNTLFDEAGLPSFPAPFPKLSPKIWAVLFRLLWLGGFSKNSESLKEAKKRALNAASYLDECSREHGTVLLMGHGVMNRLIARMLAKRGWVNTKKLQNIHWGYGVFEKKD